MRKKIGLLLVFLLVFASSCTQNENNTDNQNNRADITENDEPKNLAEKGEQEEAVLRIVVEEMDYTLGTYVELFERDHPGITVDITYYDYETDKYNEYMNTAIMSGSAPDIFSIDKTYYAKYFDGDYVLDIYKLIENDPNANLDDYWTEVLKGMAYKGKLSAFPIDFFYYSAAIHEDFADKTVPEFASFDVVSYRDMMDLYFSLEDTRDYYFTVEYGPGRAVVMDDYVDVENKQSNIDSEKFRTLIEDAKSLSPEGAPALFMAQLMYDGELMEEYSDNFIFHVIYTSTCIQALWPKTEPYLSFESPPAEKYIDYKPISNTRGEVDLYALSAYAISANTAHPELAWEFLKYITSPEVVEEAGTLTSGMHIHKETFAKGITAQFEQEIRRNTNDYERDLTDEEAAVIQEIVETLETFNTYPMSLAKYVRSEEFHEVVNNYAAGDLTLDQAVAELHNKTMLYLAE